MVFYLSVPKKELGGKGLFSQNLEYGMGTEDCSGAPVLMVKIGLVETKSADIVKRVDYKNTDFPGCDSAAGFNIFRLCSPTEIQRQWRFELAFRAYCKHY